MRRPSERFLDDLRTGSLSELTQVVLEDKDLDLQIRHNYLNIYYKGNSLLKLQEGNPGSYQVDISAEFLRGIGCPARLDGAHSTAGFVKLIPALKADIARYGDTSLEVEYEQLVIRANNLEPRNHTEYFIVDRQYVVPAIGRFDLIGVVWPCGGRRRGEKVPLCFIEVKFALNDDIRNVDQQVARYYDWVKNHSALIAGEMEAVFRQKVALGLFNQSPQRLDAMKTLRFSQDVKGY